MTRTARSTAPVPAPASGRAGAGGGPPGRLPLLDVLRGAAVLGTLMTNVWLFTGPGAEWGVLSGGAGGGGATLRGALSGPSLSSVAESLFRFLADGKFLSMLTMLFGVGLAIQFASASGRGQPWPGRYRRRALFLLAEGTVHFVLVFAWDVLMGYAVTALLVARLLARSERVRRTAMWVAAGLHLTVMALLTLAATTAGTGDGGDGPDPRVVGLYAHGGYLDQIAFRLQNAIALRMEPVLSFGLLVFLFLLGVRLFRAGVFGDDGTGRRLRVRMLRWGLGAGLPLNAATSLGGMDFFLLSRYVAAPVVAIGYLGLIGVLMDRRRSRGRGRVAAGLGSVGRMALTCYVGQNVLCVLACYGIGLGLADRFAGTGPWWVMGLWAAVALALVAGSTLWLRKFAHGPLESAQKWALRR
ncbi:DUF418 domain-containing protein [Streptomyces sp. UNOB3_S3]|uniref:DUF418 domain-containing protein n=1 Tax=Streptomyces sp. UNOB3_S3 TaxID=2871682 RepID=UPI001E42ECC6|nr:DUF418 domain-containing protein [Streptomyces sp. UNOB3_S3]MCC3777558.1 DUF418 domain-containing protein [Streptomyces sp. UNOB3_S3]